MISITIKTLEKLSFLASLMMAQAALKRSNKRDLMSMSHKAISSPVAAHRILSSLIQLIKAAIHQVNSMNSQTTILKQRCNLLRSDLSPISKRMDTKVKKMKMMKEAITSIVKVIVTLQTLISFKVEINVMERIIEIKIFKKKIPMMRKPKKENANAYLPCTRMQEETKTKTIKTITIMEVMNVSSVLPVAVSL